MIRRIALVAVLAIAAVLSSPLAASAATSSVAFAAPETTAAFGSDWVLEVRVSASQDNFRLPVTAASGSIDIVVSGIAGTFATVPLQNGGVAYFAQPADQPLLPAGAHTLTAIFNPSGGSSLVGSTSAPATLTITALVVDTTVTAAADPAVASGPVITAQLAGEYLDVTGTVPAGIWSFQLHESGTSSSLFETRLVQDPFASEPIIITVDAPLRSSTDYEVSWTFEPVAELAVGLAVATEGSASFRTPDGTIITALANPVEWPWWAWLSAGLVLVGLAVAVVVLLVQRARRSPSAPVSAVESTPEGEFGGTEDLDALIDATTSDEAILADNKEETP